MKRFLRAREGYALPGDKFKYLKLLYISLLTFFVCFIAGDQVSAQGASDTIAIDEGMRPLDVGDSIPEEVWEQYFSVLSHQGSSPRLLQLNQFYDKLLVLEFWGTWCSICINGMPDLFAHQKLFGDDIAILPVSRQQRDIVGKAMALPALQAIPSFESLVEAEGLFRLFPAEGYPNTVVIYGNRVIAITRPQYLDSLAISQVLAGKRAYLPRTREFSDLESKPMLVSAYPDITEHKDLYYSALSGFKDALSTRAIMEEGETYNRLFLPNTDLLSLYEYALSPTDGRKVPGIASLANRRIIDIPDPGRLLLDRPLGAFAKEERYSREREYCYTYEVIMPPYFDGSALRARLAYDLDGVFGVHGRIEQVMMPCLELRADGIAPTHGSPGSKAIPIHRTVRYLNHPAFGLPPVLDAVGEAVYPALSLDARVYSVEELNRILKPMGLVLRECQRVIDMFVLTGPDISAVPSERLSLNAYGYTPINETRQ